MSHKKVRQQLETSLYQAENNLPIMHTWSYYLWGQITGPTPPCSSNALMQVDGHRVGYLSV